MPRRRVATYDSRMPKNSLRICAALLVLLAPLSAAAAESPEELLLGKPYRGPSVATPRGADGKPTLTGYWKLLREPGKPDGNLAKDLREFRLPYNQAGLEALRVNVEETIDPEARCVIPGIPRLLTSVLPFEILHTPARLETIHYLSWHRWVWLDGRSPDADPDPRYLGNAIGHWEGDTLVIESRGFKDEQSWLDDDAHPHSDAMSVVERWWRPDADHLHHEVTVTDPKYYTRPFTFDRVFTPMPPGQERIEFACNENNRDLPRLGFGPHDPDYDRPRPSPK